MKWILLSCAVLFTGAVGLLFMLPPTYHYSGIAPVSLISANMLIQEKGQGDNIQIFSYNKTEDKLFISYDFSGNQDDAQKYGIPLGTQMSKLNTSNFLISVGLLIVYFATIQEWRGKLDD